MRPSAPSPPLQPVESKASLSLFVGGRGWLGGRRRLQDPVHRDRATRHRCVQLPGARGRGSGWFHFTRGRTFPVQEHDGHEAVQPALSYYVSTRKTLGLLSVCD